MRICVLIFLSLTFTRVNGQSTNTKPEKKKTGKVDNILFQNRKLTLNGSMNVGSVLKEIAKQAGCSLVSNISQPCSDRRVKIICEGCPAISVLDFLKERKIISYELLPHDKLIVKDGKEVLSEVTLVNGKIVKP